VWHSFGDPASLVPKSAELDELATAAGRDPASIMRASSVSLDDVDEARRMIDVWREAGFGYLVAGWPGAGRKQVEAFATAALQ
jgi:hypothetical protein